VPDLNRQHDIAVDISLSIETLARLSGLLGPN
jgi:hypothetical protein